MHYPTIGKSNLNSVFKWRTTTRYGLRTGLISKLFTRMGFLSAKSDSTSRSPSIHLTTTELSIKALSIEWPKMSMDISGSLNTKPLHSSRTVISSLTPSAQHIAGQLQSYMDAQSRELFINSITSPSQVSQEFCLEDVLAQIKASGLLENSIARHSSIYTLPSKKLPPVTSTPSMNSPLWKQRIGIVSLDEIA